MLQQRNQPRDRQTETDFACYLRTGRLFRPIEVKFNPYHDPYNGRFTFAPGGRATQGSTERRGASSTTSYPSTDPRNAKNHSTYVVSVGDTLEKIAKRRKGVTVADLRWLNGLSGDAPLRIGQKIKLPHQAFLDAGRAAKSKFLALDYYMRTHGGGLPPDAAHPPSLPIQYADPANWRSVDKNGYRFHLDPIGRTRLITGAVVLDPSQGRSRTAQAAAGGADRLPGDHGGHYIARRFKGPTEAFNHFAQDGNFNLSRYKMIENIWERERSAGRKVYVRVAPNYDELSRRPSEIEVHYWIEGQKFGNIFANQRGGK